jgi:hypothetical protein
MPTSMVSSSLSQSVESDTQLSLLEAAFESETDMYEGEYRKLVALNPFL